MQQHHSQMTHILESRSQELTALRAAVTAFISQPRLPPPPEPPSAAAIIETVRPRLLMAVRDDIQPLLRDLQSEVDKMLREQLGEVSGAVMSQISPTMRSVEAISAWVDRMRTPAVNMTAANTANTAVAASSSSSHVDKGKAPARP